MPSTTATLAFDTEFRSRNYEKLLTAIIVVAVCVVIAPTSVGEGVLGFRGQLASGMTDSSRAPLRSRPYGHPPPLPSPPARAPARCPPVCTAPPYSYRPRSRPRRWSRRRGRQFDVQVLVFGTVALAATVVWAAVSWLVTNVNPESSGRWP